MTAKPKAPQNKIPAKTSDKNQLKVKGDNEKSVSRQFAEFGLSPTVLSAAVARNFTKSVVGEIDINEAITVMKEKVSKVSAGDLTGLEATLIAQVTSLNTMFSALACRANNSDIMSKLEIYMRLALKAQAQCARTIEVLASMKNPPIVFAKQANIANGNQQINNGNLPNSLPTHAGKNINQSNELLEVNNGSETMDIGATKTAIRVSKKLATVEAQHRG